VSDPLFLYIGQHLPFKVREVRFEVGYLLIRSLSCFVIANSHGEASVNRIDDCIVGEALKVLKGEPFVHSRGVTLLLPVRSGASKELQRVEYTTLLTLEVSYVNTEDSLKLS
jgi:hypothetical protein